jgi:hypothetical protein
MRLQATHQPQEQQRHAFSTSSCAAWQAAPPGRPRIIIITGPTAVGKTKLGLELAKRVNGEIISADSVQVYKGLDIGSDKVRACMSFECSRNAGGPAQDWSSNKKAVLMCAVCTIDTAASQHVQHSTSAMLHLAATSHPSASAYMQQSCGHTDVLGALMCYDMSQSCV